MAAKESNDWLWILAAGIGGYFVYKKYFQAPSAAATSQPAAAGPVTSAIATPQAPGPVSAGVAAPVAVTPAPSTDPSLAAPMQVLNADVQPAPISPGDGVPIGQPTPVFIPITYLPWGPNGSFWPGRRIPLIKSP